jgi:16S rRNA (adenine1518-N6/adenine1519-N6)-dimethyltransferase
MKRPGGKVSRLLSMGGFRPDKRLGQNFLLDGNFLSFIVRSAELTRRDFVLEIGSGPGILTKAGCLRWNSTPRS